MRAMPSGGGGGLGVGRRDDRGGHGLDRVGRQAERVGVAAQHLGTVGLVDAVGAEGPVVLADDVGADPAEVLAQRRVDGGTQSVAAATSSSDSQARVRGTTYSGIGRTLPTPCRTANRATRTPVRRLPVPAHATLMKCSWRPPRRTYAPPRHLTPREQEHS